MVSITRRYRFSASHRLHSAALSEAENARIYGKCNNPFGHGHNYVLEITLAGPIDGETGLIVPIQRLDRFIQDEILERFAHRNINLDVPEFAQLPPTTENIALVMVEMLEHRWHVLDGQRRISLRGVHIQETDRNSFEVLLSARTNRVSLDRQRESVTIHV